MDDGKRRGSRQHDENNETATQRVWITWFVCVSVCLWNIRLNIKYKMPFFSNDSFKFSLLSTELLIT